MVELDQFLGSLTSLEALHLRFESRLQRGTWAQIGRLVHSLPRRTQLLELHISVRYFDPPDLPHFYGLDALDGVLQPELFKALRAVKLDVYYLEDQTNQRQRQALEDHVLAVIKNKLQKLYDRNIIEASAQSRYYSEQ